MERLRIAVVGSRQWPSEMHVLTVLNELPTADVEIISGGATGVDTIAERWAERKGVPFRKFLPDWNTHGKAAGPIRNKEIVDAAEVVIAFHHGNSKGTKSSIDHALKAKKQTVVYTIDACGFRRVVHNPAPTSLRMTPNSTESVE